ncbi:WD40 repeat domain-containing protein [Anatilimnocola sp. NA78]|uniref:WD40 repeat domain-containing protein n=1 Tax=Anatilimnocola sp. NA78 TaxID=3415683 RepID=UPI003CE482A0
MMAWRYRWSARSIVLAVGFGVLFQGCQPKVDPVAAPAAPPVPVATPLPAPAQPVSLPGAPAVPVMRPARPLIKDSPLDIDGTATFAEFSQRFAKARKDAVILPSGQAELDRLYQLVCSRGFQGAKDAQEVNQHLERWAKEDSEDPTPLIALARASLDAAYLRRGDQYAGLVSEKREQRYVLLLTSAHDLAQQALGKGARDPELARVLAVTGYELGIDRARVAEWAGAGEREFPRYFPLYTSMAKLIVADELLPLAAISAYAERIRQQVGGDDGLEAYTRIALIANQEKRNAVLFSGFSYDHLRHGANLLHQRYPDSAQLVDFLGIVAYMTGDHALANQLLPEIASRPRSPKQWDDGGHFTLFQKWCQRVPPTAEEAEVTFWVGPQGGLSLAFCDGSNVLATAGEGDDVSLRLWDLKSPQTPPRPIKLDANWRMTLDADRTGKRLLGWQFIAHCFQFPQQEGLFGSIEIPYYNPRFEGQDTRKRFFEICSDGTVAMAFEPGTIHLFNPENARQIRRFEVPPELQRLEQFGRHLSADGKWLALQNGMNIEVWDAEQGKKAYDLTDKVLKTHYLRSVVGVLPHGNLLLHTIRRTNQRGEVRLSRWNIDTQTLHHYGEVDPRLKVLASLDDRFVAMTTITSNTTYAEVSVYRLSDFQLVRTLRGHNGGIRDARFSGDGQWIGTAENAGPVRLWKLPTE